MVSGVVPPTLTCFVYVWCRVIAITMAAKVSASYTFVMPYQLFEFQDWYGRLQGTHLPHLCTSRNWITMWMEVLSPTIQVLQHSLSSRKCTAKKSKNFPSHWWYHLAVECCQRISLVEQILWSSTLVPIGSGGRIWCLEEHTT